MQLKSKAGAYDFYENVYQEFPMELTIEQALQQGVTAHNQGNLQEAERLYRAILKAQPTHPDANHNLGLIAVSVNKADAALPLFKTALEAYPKIEQFRLSYIDALIKEKQFENAKQALDQCKTQGMTGEKLNILEAQLAPINQTKNVNSVSPSQQQLSNLLEYYQNGRFGDAEKLALSITQEFPEHQSGWKVLGALFGQKGEKAEALNANQKAVQLEPQDAEAHYNLGNTLKELGRLEEAEASLGQAIALKSDFTEAHNNLGITLKELGRLEEAEASLRQTIVLKPDYVEAHNNLGNTLRLQSRLEEAETSFRQTIVLKSDYAEAHNNLGITLKELGRLEEAEASLRQTIVLKPDYVEAHNNLSTILQKRGRLEEAEASCRQAIALKPDFAEAYSNLGVTLQELGRLEEAEASFKQAIAVNPGLAKTHNNLGNTLQELERLDESEASYKQAIEVEPGYAEAHYNLGLLFHKVGEYEKAIEQFNASNFEKSKSYLLRCLYLQDQESRFFEQLDYLINKGEINSMIGSLGCRSTLRYKIERPNLFCKDPMGYVLKTDLKNQYDFEKIFVKTATTILNEGRVPYRAQELLTNGRQTFGNLFDVEGDFTEEIQQIIRAEVDKYRVHFKGSEEGLIRNWPSDYRIHGWLISMKSGGELQPHMHENGWLSGSIYINVPPKPKADSGKLVVCIEDEKLVREGVKNPKNIIDVVTGSLALFPASLLHYTIPFESEQERIVLAFDVIPK